MSSPHVLDFDALLAPIPGEAESGPDLRRDFSPTNPYRQIKDGRTAARRIESRAVWDESGAAEKADWRPIVRDGQQLIATLSKDLEVAAWITEGLVRTEGFAGLRDGFRLCRELVERYWDGLHPNPDPEEPEDEEEGLIRVAALAGLNGEETEGTLIAPIRGVSIVESEEYGPLGVSAYDQAASIETIDDPAERATRIEHGAVSLDMFNKALAATSKEFFATLRADLGEAQEEFGRLCAALEERCGPQAPPSSNIRQALEDCERRLAAVAPAEAPVEPAPEDGAAAGSAPAARRASGPIRTREDAFNAIRQVAQYFRETEPHSVLSWQLEECVRWGHMTLPDLLSDLIADTSVRDAVYKRIGIPLPPGSEEI